MMWRLWHWLFRWDYVLFEWSEMFGHQAVCRIRYDANRNPYIICLNVLHDLSDPRVQKRCRPLTFTTEDTGGLAK